MKVGIFACRTPHRPNPLGLSLGKILKIEKNKIFLEGLDVINGTPVVDIKPYLPQFENVPDAIVPSWVNTSYEVEKIPVKWADAALVNLAKWEKFSSPFRDLSHLKRALEETLELDIRSPFQKKKHGNAFSGDLYFHKFRVLYSLTEDGVTIKELQDHDASY